MRFTRFEIEGVSRNKIPTKACHTLLCVLAKNARSGGMHNFTCCNLINSNPPMGCSSITFHFPRQGSAQQIVKFVGGHVLLASNDRQWQPARKFWFINNMFRPLFEPKMFPTVWHARIFEWTKVQLDWLRRLRHMRAALCKFSMFFWFISMPAGRRKER